MEITLLPAFSDNYIFILRQGEHVAVVDPGDAAPVLDYLQRTNGKLHTILITHRHSDHIGGVKELLALTKVPVYGPAAEHDKITMLTHTLNDGDTVKLPDFELEFRVLDVGGHTLGHIAYFGQVDGVNTVFCGDTLFAGGCGRIFDGTAQQMWHSLSKLAALPADTRVYCAHEYTQSNMRFALAVEPGNSALQERNMLVAAQREANQATVPSTLSDELATNPFLRWSSPEVISAAQRFTHDANLKDPAGVFAAIREWKNVF